MSDKDQQTPRLPDEGGLTKKSAICLDGRPIDIEGARRWMIQQLAKEVVRRMKEKDDEPRT